MIAVSSQSKVVFIAELEVKPERLEDVKKRLHAVLAHANSDKEPGTLTFRVVHSGRKFVVFEEYADKEAHSRHFESDAFLELKAMFGDAFVKPPSGQSWEELEI